MGFSSPGMLAIWTKGRKNGFGEFGAFSRGKQAGDDGHGPHGQRIGNHDKNEVELDDEAVGGLYFFAHLAGYVHIGQADQEFKEHDQGHRPADRPGPSQVFL
jgi:hypothetical protein